MTWTDAVSIAVRDIRRRFGRVLLTVLAVALAAAMLTGLLIIATTARTRVLGQLSKGGPLASIKVFSGSTSSVGLGPSQAAPGVAGNLDDGDVRRIAAVPDVSSVVPVIAGQQLVVPPAPPVRPEPVEEEGADAADAGPPPASDLPDVAPSPFVETVVGVDTNKVDQLPISVLAGRVPAPGSLTEVAVTDGYLDRLHLDETNPSAVIGTELELGAPRSFPELGEQQLRARWIRTQIVGVVAQEAAPGQVLAPIEQARLAQQWSSAGADEEAAGSEASAYSALVVVARGMDEVNSVRNDIAAMGYSASAPENLIASVQRYLHVVEIVLAGIGTVALIIAALGIASALLAAVRERRREIGVLKAIGARDGDVLRLFLVEASGIGFIGGIIGAIAGWAIARAVASAVNVYLAAQGLAGVQLEFAGPILAGGIVGSTLLALLAGGVPALRAARLPAREAIGST